MPRGAVPTATRKGGDALVVGVAEDAHVLIDTLFELRSRRVDARDDGLALSCHVGCVSGMRRRLGESKRSGRGRRTLWCTAIVMGASSSFDSSCSSMSEIWRFLTSTEYMDCGRARACQAVGARSEWQLAWREVTHEAVLDACAAAATAASEDDPVVVEEGDRVDGEADVERERRL